MNADSSTGNVRVCLIGPPKGGKSHLLFALMEGIKNGAHGFPAAWGLQIRPTDRPQDTAKSAAERMKDLLNRRSEYEAGASRATMQTLEATDVGQIAQYEFEVNYQSNRRTFTVADAAGEHIFPEEQLFNGSDTDSAESEIRDQFVDYLTKSVGLVVVLPMHRVEARRFSRLMDPLINALIQDKAHRAAPSPLKRIAIALNQYERLFTDFGSDAALIAAHPAVARGVVITRLHDVPFMQRLRDLDVSWGGPYDIRVIPTSAYGFLPDFGNPNINPETGPNRRFVAFENPDGETEFEQHPFLAADPFLFAATGLKNEFMVGIDQIYGNSDAHATNGESIDVSAVDQDQGKRDGRPPRPSTMGRVAGQVVRGIEQFFKT